MPVPAYQPQTQVYLAPSVQREVCYVGGCYRLQGDGVTVAYQWVWVPAPPPPRRRAASARSAPLPGYARLGT